MMSVIAAGSLLAATALPAAAVNHPSGKHPNLTIESVTVSPKTKLVDGQVVTVTAGVPHPFGSDTKLYIAECAAAVVEKRKESYCDPTNLLTVTAVAGVTAPTPFTIHTGTDFKAPNKNALCGVPAPACLILVSDSKNPKKIVYAGFNTITFKDLRAATTTKLTAKKKAKVGKKLTLVAKTTHGTTKPTGTVIFRDNGKKIGTVTEKATGKVKLKYKFAKKGKQHITVKYSGDTNYKPSSAKTVITIKK
jgi:hypothetical protein